MPATAAKADIKPEASPEATGEDASAPTAKAESDVEMAQLFTLPNANGGEVSLASYLGDSNVVVVFYRAFW